MKKFLLLIFILFYLFLPTTTIFASTDTAFTTSRLNKFGSVIVKATNTFGFDIADVIMPFFTKEEEIATPDFEPLDDFTSKINQRIFPQGPIDAGKVNHWTNSIVLKSLYGAILKTDAEYSDHPPPTDCFISVGIQKSSDVPFANSLFENIESIDAFWGLMPKETAGDGVLDFNRADKALGSMNGGEDCKKHDIGAPLPDVANDLTSLSSFGGEALVVGTILEDIFVIVEKIINGVLTEHKDYLNEPHKDDVILTQKQRQPWFQMLCHVFKCPSDETGEATNGLGKTGGMANAFLSPEFQKPVMAAGVHPISISVLGFKQKPHATSYDNENQADWGLGRMGCAAAPDSLQKNLSVGKTRPIIEKCNPPPKFQCPIDVIKAKAKSPSDNACTISGAGGLSSFMSSDQKSVYGSGLSTLAMKVLETAADTYKVPASVLLATMLHEGAFNHEWRWSDDKLIEQYSDCNNPEPIPSCNAYAISSGSKAPFGWIDSRWDAYIDGDKNPYNGKYLKVELEGMDEVLKNVKNFNSCNFADAAFMAARAISEDFSHPVTAVPAMCIAPQGNIPMFLDNYRPESCSSWTAERVATTRFQYAGGASIGTCTTANPGESYNIGHVVDIWKALTP